MVKKILLLVLLCASLFSCQTTDTAKSTHPLYNISENALYDYQASELGLGIPSWVTASEKELSALFPRKDLFLLLEESEVLDYLQQPIRPLSYPRNLLVSNPDHIPTEEDLIGYTKQTSFWLSYQVPDMGILYHYLTLYVKE